MYVQTRLDQYGFPVVQYKPKSTTAASKQRQARMDEFLTKTTPKATKPSTSLAVELLRLVNPPDDDHSP